MINRSPLNTIRRFFVFLRKCHFLFYSSVLVLPSALASSSSTCISVATPVSEEEVISRDAASLIIFGIEKNNVSNNFVDFHPIIITEVLLLIPYKKTGKSSSDGKTLLQIPIYDINEEADRIWKGSSNKKYRIVMVISSVVDVSICTWK